MRKIKNIFAPVSDAIQKSGLEESKIHSVLFIGGSAKSAYSMG